MGDSFQRWSAITPTSWYSCPRAIFLTESDPDLDSCVRNRMWQMRWDGMFMITLQKTDFSLAELRLCCPCGMGKLKQATRL